MKGSLIGRYLVLCLVPCLFSAGCETDLVVLKPGDAAPAFTLESLGEETLSLSDIDGRYVMVRFWADWCKRCDQVQEHLVELVDEMNGRARIARLNVDDNEEVPYRFGIRSVPTLILFEDGTMVDQLVGAAPKETIRRMIHRIREA